MEKIKHFTNDLEDEYHNHQEQPNDERDYLNTINQSRFYIFTGIGNRNIWIDIGNNIINDATKCP